MASEVSAQVKTAINSLSKWVTNEGNKNDDKSGKKALFPDEQHPVFLFCVMKRINEHRKLQYLKIQLPHPFRDPKTTSICLFTKDLSREKWDPDVDKDAKEFEEYLTFEKDVEGIDQIISLRQLKREYKTFEAKRKLCSAYDLFVVDDRVTSQISRNLGKAFHKAKKQPFPINIAFGKVAEKVQNSYGKIAIQLQAKQTFSVKFGHLSQSPDHLTSNFEALSEVLRENLSGGWPNIRSLYVHIGGKSPKLPIYVSLESPNFVKMPPPPRKRMPPIEDELSTLEYGEKVKVHADGRVQIFDKDGNEIVSKKRKPKEKKRSAQSLDKSSSSKKRKQNTIKTETKEHKLEVKSEVDLKQVGS